MNALFDTFALAAGVAATPDHRPVHPASVKTRRSGPAGRFVRNVLSDIRGAMSLHAFEDLGLRLRRRKAIAELDALDNRTLEDIGINRRSIPEVVDAQLGL